MASKKKLPPRRRARVVVDKAAGEMTQREIAAKHGITQASVSRINYSNLTDDEKRHYHEIMENLSYRTAGLVDQLADSLEQQIPEANTEPSAKNIAPIASALKTVYDIHLRASGQASQIVEHRLSDLELAKSTYKELLASDLFDEETALEAAADAYKVDIKLLTEGE